MLADNRAWALSAAQAAFFKSLSCSLLDGDVTIKLSPRN
ncbi:hypothetical protein CZ787_16290 [Halomonas citrativorans]|uniref:Uncharacterized protein n=1 Tax=Halomonas citrativorans TaxID=2742612 RepID=A0A1R4I480_9GAMM|nr:hypothetical protein CZ787_16290 [Halomonas citrativorans]